MFCVWKFNGLIRKEGRLGGREVTKNGVWLLCQLYYCDFVCLFLPGIKKILVEPTAVLSLSLHVLCPSPQSATASPPSRITSSRITLKRL